VGLLVDNHASAIIKRALGAEDTKAFQDYSGSRDHVASILEFFNAQRDLTDDEILGTWNPTDGPAPESVIAGYVQTVARLRVLREMMAWRPTDSPELPDVPPIETLKDWAAVQRAMSR